VNELNTKILPDDVKVVSSLDRSWLVNETVHTVGRTLVEGMGLVILVLLLFLGSARGALFGRVNDSVLAPFRLRSHAREQHPRQPALAGCD